MDGYERSQFVGRHFPSFTNVANSGKNCKKRLILFSSNPRKKTTSWQRFWKFEPWKMMTTREIAGRGGGGSAIFSPYLISHTFLKWELQIWNLLQIFLYIGEGGAQGVKKGTAPPRFVSHLIRSLITVFLSFWWNYGRFKNVHENQPKYIFDRCGLNNYCTAMIHPSLETSWCQLSDDNWTISVWWILFEISSKM